MPCSSAPAESSRRPRQGADLAELAPQLLPRRAAVGGAIHLPAHAVGIDERRIGSMHGKVPHRAVGPPWHLGRLPVRAAVERTRHQARRAGGCIAVAQQQHLGLRRVLRQAAKVGQGQALAQLERRPGVAGVEAHVRVVVGGRHQTPAGNERQRVNVRLKVARKRLANVPFELRRMGKRF